MKNNSSKMYDIISPTSMGVRITPLDRQPVHTSDLFQMQATSAESNVLSIGASLGLKTKVLTAFVKNSPIAKFIKDNLAHRHIDYDNNEKTQEGPWGYRHQFNIADSGFGLRAPIVLNDRAGEVGQSLKATDFDLDALFKVDGVKLIHISGLIAALSEETSQFCLDLAMTAKKHGTMISFDINYRESFWKNREKDLRRIFQEIASQADILIGNEEDFQLALGVEGPKSGGENLTEKFESFKKMIDSMKQTYPNVKIYANTLREVVSANEHLWGAIVKSQNEWHVEYPRPIQVIDRIGGGDGFVGGFLYGLLNGWDVEKSMQFGWASGAYVVTLLTDYGTPISEDQIWSIYKGNARVVR